MKKRKNAKQVPDLAERLEEVMHDASALQEALLWYANATNHERRMGLVSGPRSHVERDGGMLARIVLGIQEPE